uniref:Uncharacterized protein n=1 Tax=Nucleocytoviricota sp. TaxID=2809609 RepID=A0A9E8JZB3_9VIRU|nr:hypothetical protein [Nucleocytoviricota sp.]UZT29158.1 hypothetical protein [Nucleocytoviricota sp.]
MLNNFNSLVLQIATVILIILLIVIGIVMYYSAKNAEFPPVIGECPDYWNVAREGDKTICKNILKVNPKSVSETDRCNKIDPVNFTGPTNEETVCNKYKWANGCGVVWDGVTNNNASCVR